MKTQTIFLALIFYLLVNTGIMYSRPYFYPYLPGSDMWKKQTTYIDKIKLCNIPDSILKTMTTEDLIETVFNFPFIQNLILYDNFLWGYDNLKSVFNGLDELTIRRESPQQLFEIYCSNENKNGLGKNIILESMMSLPFVLESLDSSQKKILLDSCLNKLSVRIEKKHFLKEKSMVSASFLMIRLLSYLDKNQYNSIIENNEDIKKFSLTSEYPSKETITKIIYEIIQFKR